MKVYCDNVTCIYSTVDDNGEDCCIRDVLKMSANGECIDYVDVVTRLKSLCE